MKTLLHKLLFTTVIFFITTTINAEPQFRGGIYGGLHEDSGVSFSFGRGFNDFKDNKIISVLEQSTGPVDTFVKNRAKYSVEFIVVESDEDNFTAEVSIYQYSLTTPENESKTLNKTLLMKHKIQGSLGYTATNTYNFSDGTLPTLSLNVNFDKAFSEQEKIARLKQIHQLKQISLEQ